MACASQVFGQSQSMKILRSGKRPQRRKRRARNSEFSWQCKPPADGTIAAPLPRKDFGTSRFRGSAEDDTALSVRGVGLEMPNKGTKNGS
jgi:hypothetical protein